MPLGLLLLGALLLLLVDLFDRRLIADPVASLVEEQTGRSLQIGNFDLRWRWPLLLHAENVRFANADWGSEAPLLHAAAVSVSIHPLELLSGAPYADVHVQDPQVLIERSEAGEWNWLIDTSPSGTEKEPRLPVTVEASGGRILYEDTESLVIDLHHLSLVPAENRDLDLALRASQNNMPLEVDGTLASTAQNREGVVTLRAGESSLTARFTADTGADPLRVRATIDSGLLVPYQLAELLPAGEESDEAPPPSLPNLNGVDAELDLRVATLRLRDLDLENLQGGFSIRNGRAQLTELKTRVGGAEVEASAEVDTTAPEPALRLTADLARTPLASLPGPLPLSEQPGDVAVQLSARLEMPDRTLPLAPAQLLSQLAVPESRVLYATERGEREQAAIIARLRVQPAGGEPAMDLAVDGVEAPPFSATLSAPPLRELAEQTPYPVQLAVSTDGAQARIEAQLGRFLRENRLQATFSAGGNKLPALPDFGFTPPPVPEFSLSGTLQRETGRWRVPEFEISYGQSQLAGSAVYDVEGKRPVLRLDAESPLLDLTAVPQDVSGEAGPEKARDAEGWVPEGIADALRKMDADVDLSAGRVHVTDEYSLEAVKLSVLLDEGRLQADPVAFEIAGGSVRGSVSAQAVPSPVEGRLSLDVESLALRHFGDFLVPLEKHFGRLSGELHLTAAEARPGQQSGDIILPTLGRLSLDDTRLRFHDADAETDLTLTVATGGLSAPDEEESLVLQAEGVYRGEPVEFRLRGGPLPALRDPRSPYPLQAEIELAGAQARLDGRVRQPWAPQFAQLGFSGSARDPAPLEKLLDPLVSVSLPAFEIDGTFDYETDQFALQDFSARFGDSDIRGDASLSMSAETPMVAASLQSDTLNVDDVTGVMDGDGDDNGQVTGTTEDDTKSRYLLSQQQFDLSALRAANADIRYTAGDVDAAGIPLGSVTASVRLQDGRLLAEPVRIETADGGATIRVDMHTRPRFIEGVVDIEARGLSLSDMLADIDIASNSFGIVGGQGKFWLQGDSLASVIGSADGGMMLLMTGGALDSLLVEVAGLDIGEAALAASGLYNPAYIDCAYASLHSTDGLLDVDRFVIDTNDTTFFLNGSVDLSRETLDLALFSEAKDPSFPATESPLAFTGSLGQPEVDLLTGELAARAVGAAALSALAGPVAAVLPFIEPGLQDEPSVCKGWVEELRQERTDEP